VLGAMHAGMRVLMLGVDYRRFAKFERLTPRVFMTFGSAPNYTITDWTPPPHSAFERTEDDADFCIEFVVESALRLQDVDLTVPVPAQPAPTDPSAPSANEDGPSPPRV
jgi:hypothetical protein